MRLPIRSWRKSLSSLGLKWKDQRPRTAQRDRRGSFETLEVRQLLTGNPVIGSLTISPQPVTEINTVTLTAHNITDTGGTVSSVSFYRDSNQDGSLEAGTDQLLGTATSSSGWALSISSSVLPVGSQLFFAQAVDNTSALSAPVSVTDSVLSAATATTVDSSVDQNVTGQSVTFTATVAASSNGTPTGTVTFMDGTTTLGTGTLASSSGQDRATFSTSSLAAGSHSITAVYSGDANFATSTSPVFNQQVIVASTSTEVESGANPAVWGQSVRFTATVFGAGGGTPTGTVTFMDGSTTLGTGTLAMTGGQDLATYTTTNLAVASHSITAVYGGDSNFAGSTSPVFGQQVAIASTSIGLASGYNASQTGQSVRFTATIYDGAGAAPTGTVTFMDGSTTLGTGNLALSGGQDLATFTTTSLAAGSHSITAVYGGTSNFGASTSPIYTQQVAQSASSVGVVCGINPSLSGQSIQLLANVYGADGSTPTGTVTFYDGSTSLGTNTLSGGTT